jgi:hypothetical protein
MKTFTNIFGLFTAFIAATGAFCKVFHFPGGNIFLILSVGLLIPLFFLFIMISTYKERKVIAPLIIIGFFLLFFLVGSLFLLMHWPGGSALTFLTFIPLTFTLLAFSVVYMSKKPEERKLNPTVLIFSILAVSLLYASLYRSTTKGTLVGHLIAAENGKQITKDFQLANKEKINALDSSKVHVFQSSNIHGLTIQIVDYCTNLNRTLCQDADGDYENLERVPGLDHTDLSYYRLTSDNTILELGDRFQNLTNQYNSLNISEESKQKIREILSFKSFDEISEGEEWQTFYFNNTPVISSIATLISFQNKVLLAENIALTELSKK